MTLLEAALAYAKKGRAIFPLDGKVPRTRRGLHDATTDVGQIHLWWQVWPTAGIGMPMGAGIFAVDIDGEPGRRSLRELEAELGPLPTTLTNVTARGVHLIYLEPSGRTVKNRAGVAPGIDVRATGGYIVVGPSRHPEIDHVYQWRRAPIVAAPEAWIDRIAPATRAATQAPRPPSAPVEAGRAVAWAHGAMRGEADACANSQPGTRNHRANVALLKLGKMVGGGLLERHVVEEVIASACEQAGLSHREIAQLLRPGGALDKGAATPVYGPAIDRDRRRAA